MLKHLQKLFAAPVAQQETQEENVTMVVIEQGSAPAADASVVDVASLQATIDTLTEKLADTESKFAELTTLVAKSAELTAAKEAAALEAKLASRLKTIEATVGTEKATQLMAATTSLDDAAFDAVISAMQTATNVEAKTELFTEQGIEAQSDVQKLVAENGVGEILRAKYQTSNSK